MMLLLTNHLFKRPPWFWGLENIFRKTLSTTYMAGWKIHHEWVDVFPMGKMVIFHLAMLVFFFLIGCLGYIGDYTAQWYGDHFINHCKGSRIPIKQQPGVSVFLGGLQKKNPWVSSLAFPKVDFCTHQRPRGTTRAVTWRREKRVFTQQSDECFLRNSFIKPGICVKLEEFFYQPGMCVKILPWEVFVLPTFTAS